MKIHHKQNLLIKHIVIFTLSLVVQIHLQAAKIGYAPATLLVKPKKDTSTEALKAIYDMHGAVEVTSFSQIGIRVINVPPNALLKVMEAIRQHPKVEYVELDYVLSLDLTPNDTYFASQWHLPKIKAPDAWDISTGNSSVIIAICDTGIDDLHPDLSANIVPGRNVYDNNSNTRDVYGHGTQVAGTAAAIGNNGLGVASVAWNCRIMPIRISDTSGYATYTTIVKGITYAADNGARVANISYSCSTSSAVADAARYMQSKGGVVTVSAGNASTFDNTGDNPYVLTVSATDSSDTITSWSNTGNLIDVSAPGLGILTTTRGGGYGSVSGTSFSAPIVAGIAALAFSVNPSLNPIQVQEIIKYSAYDLGESGWDPKYGWGRVNAYNAVVLAKNTVGQLLDTTAPLVRFVIPANNTTVQGSTVVQLNASDNLGVAKVVVQLDGVEIFNFSSSPYEFVWDTTTTSDGNHMLTAFALDAAGNSSQASINVEVRNTIDTQVPTINITSPVFGAILQKQNQINVTVSVQDNVGVSRVELYVDGKLIDSSTAAPFTTKWNSNKAPSGAHVIQCRAYDAAGNIGYSQQITVVK